MSNKEKAMQILLELSEKDRADLLAFFGYRVKEPSKRRTKKRLRKGDPILSKEYHLKLLYKRFNSNKL